jgi:large subunit ribosomal protein L21
MKERCNTMFAVIECGGKQYKVSEGDTIYVEKLEMEDGASVEFNALMTVVDGNVALNQGTVSAEVVKTGKQKKIMVFKYNAKKNYRRRQGHRQPYTKLVIKSVKA